MHTKLGRATLQTGGEFVDLVFNFLQVGRGIVHPYLLAFTWTVEYTLRTPSIA